VLSHARSLADQGYAEIVLTGIHLGDYGKDLRNSTLSDLVGALAEVGPRIRLSSLDPHEVTPELVALVARHPRVCRHLHVCLQSGSPRVLKAMRRHYRAEAFEALVADIHDADPEICIGTDVIVGFPGETAEEHRETVDMLMRLPIPHIHVFPYSARAQTAAAEMEGEVPAEVIDARTREVLDLSRVRRREFYQRLVGREVQVLAENPGRRNPESTRGFTDNYVPVRFSVGSVSAGEFVRVRVEATDGAGAWGTVAPDRTRESVHS